MQRFLLGLFDLLCSVGSLKLRLPTRSPLSTFFPLRGALSYGAGQKTSTIISDGPLRGALLSLVAENPA